MKSYFAKRNHVPASPEALAEAEAWFRKNTKLAQDPDIERVFAPTLVVSQASAPASTEPRCSFCARPIFEEFAYVRPTSENKGLCKRLDCKKHRQDEKKAADEADPLAHNPDLDVDDDVSEGGDAVDDFIRSQQPKEEELQPGAVEILNTGQEEEEPTKKSTKPRTETQEENVSEDPAEDAAEGAEPCETIAHTWAPFGLPAEDMARLQTLLRKPGFVEECKALDLQQKWRGHGSVREIPSRERRPQEEVVYEIETKDELELMKREALDIEKERLEKEEMAKRRIVKKRRPRAPVLKETPTLRLQHGFSTRELAFVLDNLLFNKPFQVKDRSLLYNRSTLFGKWYAQLEKDSKAKGVPIWEARRRGDSRYEKEAIVPGFIQPEIQIIDGVMVSLDLQVKTVEEILPDGAAKIHVVQQFGLPNKIKPRTLVRSTTQKSPSTYGDLLNALPYRPEVMVTPEERAFYKDYAAGNLSSYQLDRKHGERTPEDILLLENRIIRHALKLRLLDYPWKVTCALDKYNAQEEYNNDEAWKADIKMISKTGGAYIGGGVHAARLDRYGRRSKLDSFDTQPLRDTRGGKRAVDNGGPEHDDYGDESGA